MIRLQKLFFCWKLMPLSLACNEKLTKISINLSVGKDFSEKYLKKKDSKNVCCIGISMQNFPTLTRFSQIGLILAENVCWNSANFKTRNHIFSTHFPLEILA